MNNTLSIEVNNQQVLKVALNNEVQNMVFVLHDKEQIKDTRFIEAKEIVAIHNLIALLYDNNISVEELLVYGKGMYNDIEQLRKEEK